MLKNSSLNLYASLFFQFCITIAPNKSLFFLFSIIVSSILPLSGQQIHGIENHGVTGFVRNDIRVGQTFMNNEDGQVNSVSFVIPANGVGDWEFYIGEEPGEGMLIPGPAYQDFSITTLGIITVPLNTPFSISAGKTYRFEIIPKTILPLSFYRINAFHPAWMGSDYNGGHEVLDGVYFDGNHVQITPNAGFNLGRTNLLNDLDFGISISPAPPIPIPTLSQWGLIILTLVILNLSLFLAHNKELIS